MECGRYAYFSVHLFWDAVFRCDFCSSWCFVYAPASLALHPEFLLFPLKQSRGKKNPSTCGCMWCVCACGKSSISAVAFLYLSGGDMFDCPRCIFSQWNCFFFLTSVSCFFVSFNFVFFCFSVNSFLFSLNRFVFGMWHFMYWDGRNVHFFFSCSFDRSIGLFLFVNSATFFSSHRLAASPIGKNIRAFLLTSLAYW